MRERDQQPEPKRRRLVTPTQRALTTRTLTPRPVLGHHQRRQPLGQIRELQRRRATQLPRRLKDHNMTNTHAPSTTAPPTKVMDLTSRKS